MGEGKGDGKDEGEGDDEREEIGVLNRNREEWGGVGRKDRGE